MVSSNNTIISDDETNDSIHISTQHFLWLVAAGLAVLAALFGALGDNLIKLSFTKEKRRRNNGDPDTIICCRPLWVLGLVSIVVVNTALTLVSYSLADASLLIPFTGLHIVFNMIFANRINKEKLERKQVGFTFIILLGVTLVLLGGNHTTKLYSMHDLDGLFDNLGFIVSTIVITTAIVSLGLAPFCLKSPKLKCLATSMVCGAVGSMTQLFAKTLSESITQLIEGNNIFKDDATYIAFLVTIFLGVSQFALLNRALMKYNAFVVSPFVNSVLIILGSIYSAVFFEEWKRFNTRTWVMLPVGIIVTSLGVSLLAWHHDPLTKEDKTVEEELDNIVETDCETEDSKAALTAI